MNFHISYLENCVNTHYFSKIKPNGITIYVLHKVFILQLKNHVQMKMEI